MGLAEIAGLGVRLTLDAAGFNTGLKRATGSLNKFDSRVGSVGRGAGQLSSGLARSGAIIGTAVVGGFTAAAKAAIDYESAFAGVRKTVDASEAEFVTLSDQFRALARTIPISATEFARLGEMAGALGVNVNAIDEFVEVTAKLGVTTDLTADAAAEALGKIGNIVGLTAEEYDNFGSALVRLGNTGASTEPEIIEITKRIAGAGDQAGLSAAEMLGFSEAIASFTGLQPEAGGTAFAKTLRILTLTAANGGKKFDVLNEVVGEDFKKALDKDASGAVIKFLRGLGKLDKYERARVLKTIGLDAGYASQLLTGLSTNVDDVEKSLKNADDGWQGNFLNKEAETRFNTLASKIDVFKNNLVDAGITIGTGMLPSIERATEKLTEFLQKPENVKELTQIGKDVGAAIDSIDWEEVVRTAKSLVGVMKSAFTWAKRLFDIFNALPGEIKGAVAGLLVLNKLSGGLIGGGLGNIVGGLLGPLARNAGAALPGIGKAFVQPVFVTNMPPGGIGGLGAAAGGAATLSVGALLLGVSAAAALGGVIATAIARPISDLIDPSLTRRIDAGDTPLANRDPRRFDSSGRVVNQFEEDLKDAGKAAQTLGVKFGRMDPTRPPGDRPSPGNPGQFKANIDKIGFDKWVTKANEIKGAVTTTGSQQKAELSNIKNNIQTQTNMQIAQLVAERASLVAQTVAQGVHALGQSLAMGTQTGAIRTGTTQTATASRNAGTQTATAMSIAATRIVAAVYAARPVIRTTNIVEKNTVIKRYGGTSDSRTYNGTGNV
jgi:TP901 family phage tail tape measure protein